MYLNMVEGCFLILTSESLCLFRIDNILVLVEHHAVVRELVVNGIPDVYRGYFHDLAIPHSLHHSHIRQFVMSYVLF